MAGGYLDFLATKMPIDNPSGFDVDPCKLNPKLFPFQAAITRWAIRRGRAAIWADTGLGKGPMQLEWARLVAAHTEQPVLILAPLAVSQQFARNEGPKFGIPVAVCRSAADMRPGVNVANYEMLGNFYPESLGGLACDESSILKGNGPLRQAITDFGAGIAYRLASSATPAPNDYMEIGNHAEFLGVMKKSEMLAMFFIHDGGDTQKWRLKGHAQSEFWRWLCSWAVMINKPSDIGFSDDGYNLPPLNIVYHEVSAEVAVPGQLFDFKPKGLQERRAARRQSMDARVAKAAEIANSKDAPWLVWCDLNDESAALTRAVDDAVEVKGADIVEHKEESVLGFLSGSVKRLISKPSIFGFGLNLQHCADMVFVGLSDSYEATYQAIRRCWRFGQTQPVNVHIVTSTAEGDVVANIKRKEADAIRMRQEMVRHMADITKSELGINSRQEMAYRVEVAEGQGWKVVLGDCVEVTREMDPDSVHFTIFSPPYASLYTYSNSIRDMGNSHDDSTFARHFIFLVRELFRVTKPGRIVAVDCMNLPAMKERDGYIGLKDFRGQLIRTFQRNGFIMHSEHCIWKDPLIEATRTKALGLMHKQLCKDSAMCRAGIPQYLLAFRKPGENQEPVAHPNGLTEFYGENGPAGGVLSHERWRRYASPVWTDIDFGNTLNAINARHENDERHICPMSLDIIARGLHLWSNPGDLVFDPFNGIGSTGYQAVQMGRRYLGVELKESYWAEAVKNLQSAQMASMPLFAGAE
ncbi:MAG: hypothetical protein LDL07_09975 [Desulfarculus sp.]|nr:hypothetical protein [Desulfarculus sp.]